MSGILRRTTLSVTPSAQLSVDYYFRCLAWAVNVGQQLIQDAHARLFTTIRAPQPPASPDTVTTLTATNYHAQARPSQLRAPLADTNNNTSLAVSSASCGSPARLGSSCAAPSAHGVAAPAERHTGDVPQDAPESDSTTTAAAAAGAVACAVVRATASSSSSSPAPPPPPTQAGSNGAGSPTPSTPPPLPDGAYAKGRPELHDRFVRIPGSPRAGPATICYQQFGDPAHPPLVLLAGLAHSCLYWRDSLCAALADAGFFVVRLDNRDAGLSSHMDAWSPPPLWRGLLPSWLAPSQASLTPPYLVSDLGQDVVQCMDALGLRHAHVMGSSMGGMIAQEVALHAPERVTSLTLLFTSAGGKPVKPPPLRARLGFLDRPKGSGLTALVDFKVRLDKRNAGRLPFDEVASRVYWSRALQRSPNDPASFQRQLWSLLKSPSRVARLREVSQCRSFPPTTVLHGTADETIPHENGEQLAVAIHGSKLVLIPDMGHAVPASLDAMLVAQVATQLTT